MVNKQANRPESMEKNFSPVEGSKFFHTTPQNELAKEEKREPKIFELFTCHTLRHTYAARCFENGVDQQVVQKLLGHSTLAMTTDLYTEKAQSFF